MIMTELHTPVLLDETLNIMLPGPGGVLLDGTCGEGGHAEAFLRQMTDADRLLGVDRDPEILAVARQRLEPFGQRAMLRQMDFRQAAVAFASEGLRFGGILLDLGISSFHFDSPERGFAFSHSGPLDMRLDRQSGSATAADLLNGLTERELRRIFWEYGEEREAGRIARAVIAERGVKPLATTVDFAALVERSVPRRRWPERIHPATRVFQALRIAVNSELEGLGRALGQLAQLLVPGGRMAVISFHSLEDRTVKLAFRELTRTCRCPEDSPICQCGGQADFRAVTRKPIVPAQAEIERNPRSRSAKLRAVERTLEEQP